MESILKIDNKIIQRAIATELVNDTSNVIKLASKYDNSIDKSISYKDLLDKVILLIQNNKEFNQKFSDLLVKNKQIVDYNKSFNNAAGIAAAISNVITGISNIAVANKTQNTQQQQINAQSTQSIMNFMMQEENNRLASQQSDNNLIYLAIGGAVLIVGIVLFTRKK